MLCEHVWELRCGRTSTNHRRKYCIHPTSGGTFGSHSVLMYSFSDGVNFPTGKLWVSWVGFGISKIVSLNFLNTPSPSPFLGASPYHLCSFLSGHACPACILEFFHLSFFWQYWVWTQGLPLARQASTTHTSSPASYLWESLVDPPWPCFLSSCTSLPICAPAPLSDSP
jgi:hypothetical protein